MRLTTTTQMKVKRKRKVVEVVGHLIVCDNVRLTSRLVERIPWQPPTTDGSCGVAVRTVGLGSSCSQVS